MLERFSWQLPSELLLCLLHSLSLSTCLSSSLATDRVHVYTITEAIPADTFIANLLIDSGLAVRYSPNIQSKLRFVFLKEVQHLELFALDERNGILRTGRMIDRDVICPGQLSCMIRLDLAVQPSAYFEVIKIEISILDINDNSPTFEDPRILLVIPENTPPRERFLLPSASDVDSVPNGVVEYRLLSATTHFQLDVKNDLMGRPREVYLMLQKELDREQQAHFELLLAAYDGGIPRRSAVLTIAVQVGDVNDNSPKFEKSTYNVSISENTPFGATIIQLRAIDQDIGLNGHIRYRFSQRSESNYGDLFAIDSENGDVVLLQTLHHASSNVYSLGVIAEDQGEYSSPALAALIVTVVDVNDNAPQIIIDALSASGSVEVNENSNVGTFVAHVSTSDKDEADNGLVQCSINNDNFRLIQIYDGEYKLVTAKVFDRETVSRYEVVIRCHDMGEPKMFVNKAIFVNVADVNDNHPVFTYTIYNATVQENLPWGTFLVRVSAHDADEGVNGEIAYMLDSDTDQRFHIDPDSGVITTLAGLDRELSGFMEFHVLATNKGEHGRFSRALIRVHVTDVDDESPKFLSDKYMFDVFENQPPKTEVGQVMAEDLDQPPFNSFSYIIRNNRMFSIDPKSGIIYTRKTLDREMQDQYEVSVEVVSNAVLIKHDSVVVTVNVIDTNDNAPNITFPSELNHTVAISSMLKVLEVICIVKSHDLDVGVNSELSYEILDGNGTKLFGIEPVTGQVRLLKEIHSYGNETFVIYVRVKDGGQPVQISTVALHVMVIDGLFPVLEGFPELQNQWTWFSDMRVMIITGMTSLCFIFIVLLLMAVLLVQRKKKCHRGAVLATMKNVMTEQDEAKEDDTDADSLSRMKRMMNDGQMVRMKDISYTELSSDISCNTSHHLQSNSYDSSGCGIELRARPHINVVLPATFDPDTDSGYADLSHCNDNFSSGSDRSCKDVGTVLHPKKAQFSSTDNRFPFPLTVQVSSSSQQHSPKHVTVISSGLLEKTDAKRHLISPSTLDSACAPSTNSALFNCSRKIVRFADAGRKKSDTEQVIHSNNSKTSRGTVETGQAKEKEEEEKTEEEERNREQTLLLDRTRSAEKMQVYSHNYPNHVTMTTFLPEEGSLV